MELSRMSPGPDPVSGSPNSAVWKSQPWYPVLLGMLIDYPRLIHHTQQGTDSQELNPQLAYLRKRCRAQDLSERATDLVLKSWRTKTNKSYDSLFGRWNRWCDEWGEDPISGPMSGIANFIADLHEKGYQYIQLNYNAYRSAISSVHERVDGFNVGQHPQTGEGNIQ